MFANLPSQLKGTIYLLWLNKRKVFLRVSQTSLGEHIFNMVLYCSVNLYKHNVAFTTLLKLAWTHPDCTRIVQALVGLTFP